MHIGITGPISLTPLQDYFPGDSLPETHSFPLIGLLARELHDRGHQVSVFAGSPELTDIKLFNAERLHVWICPRRKKRAPYDFYKTERAALVEAMKRSECEIIHAHWTYEFAAAAQAAGKPHLITAHDSPAAILRFFITTRYAPFWTFRSLLGASVARRAGHLTAVSPYLADHVRRTLGLKQPIEIVPNGAANWFFELGQERLARGEPTGPITIATVMDGFDGRKNGKAAIAGFQLMRQAIPDARLRMHGDGYGPGGNAECWARGKGLSEGVEFRGKTPQAQLASDLSHEAHILLHSSVEESFGMAPLEAMAMGIPVVAGKWSGAIPFVVGENGLLVDVRNPNAIAEALSALATDSALRKKMAGEAWKSAFERFSLKTMVDQYASLYKAVLA